MAAVDDHPLTLEGIASTLAHSQRCLLTVSATSVTELLEILDEDPSIEVDVVLLDLRLPKDPNPLDNVRRLRARGTKVLVYSSLESPYLARQAMKGDCSGVVQKTASISAIEEAIVTAAKGETFATTEWASFIDSDPLLNALELTDKQRQVLTLYSTGEPAKRVARIMGIKPSTVQDYLDRIRAKYADLGRRAETKPELLLQAIRDGYVAGPTDPECVEG